MTDKASWRWCFYINRRLRNILQCRDSLLIGSLVPIGVVAAAGVLVFLHVNQQLDKAEGSLFDQIMRFDPIGNVLFISAIICLLLALQWGGTTYDWSNGRIVALFVLFGLLFIAFIAVQVWLGEKATGNSHTLQTPSSSFPSLLTYLSTVPSRVANQRTIRFSSLFALSVGATVFPLIYYLPIWFQSTHGDTAITSAIHMLPLILSQVISVTLAGGLTRKIGYYMPFVWISVVLMPIGVGLLTTFYVGISEGKWIGYQILFGIGLGFGFQQANIAAQAVLPLRDVPTGVAVTFSTQFLGGTVFVSVAENVFTNHLRSNIAKLNIPNFNPEMAVKTGATDLRNLVKAEYLGSVLGAYNDAIVKAFQVALIMSCLAGLGAVGMEWRDMKGGKKKEGDGDGE